MKEVDLIELREYFGELFTGFGLKSVEAEWGYVLEPMKELVPVAAAYWIDRLCDDGKLMVHINKRPMSRTKLLVVTAHEVLGHLYHYDLVRKHCFDLSKRLPVMNRYPLTEGVAMMAEDKLAEILDDENILKMVLRGKLLRCVRYLFELLIYKEKIDLDKAIDILVDLSGLDENDLREDLLSFLSTPGYASCYWGGYLRMKSLKVDFWSAVGGRKLGEMGMDIFITPFNSPS